jgi:threonine/homoserine/homoserine lactone efflux protein
MPRGGGALLPAAMVVTMAGLAFAGLVAFALVAGRLRAALARPRVARAVNGAVGGLLVALAAKLAGAAR